jgi:hypothetical protein
MLQCVGREGGEIGSVSTQTREMDYVTEAKRMGNVSARRGPPAILAAASALAFLAWPSAATANEFPINACQADRENYSTQAFEDFATRGMLDALEHLQHDRTTVVLNKARPHAGLELSAVDECFRQQRLHRSVTIPYDERLAVMLDSGTYALEALNRRSRLPIKQLGLAVAEQLA